MAQMDDRIGWYWVEKLVTDTDPLLVMFCCQFDEQCDQDDIAIKEMMRLEKRDRKLALIRCVSFPTDFLGRLLLFDFSMALQRWYLQKALFSFVFKKITYRELAQAIKAYG